MALFDYILCSDCGRKAAYDADDIVSERLMFSSFKVICPECADKLRATITEQQSRISHLEEIERTNDTLLDQLGDKNAHLLDRIKALEDALDKFKDELFAVLIQDMSRDSAVKKINELIGG